MTYRNSYATLALLLAMAGLPAALHASGDSPSAERVDTQAGLASQHLEETGAQPPVAEAYALVDASVVALHPWAFVPLYASEVQYLSISGENTRNCTNNCTLGASIQLPSGARVLQVELAAYDANQFANVAVRFNRCGNSNGDCTPIADLGTAIAFSAGDTLVSAAADHTVQNSTNTYSVFLYLSGGTGATSITGFRVYYKRQISPAPGVATFSDVPKGHQFFQGIEALAASGITGGCGGGKYCPDDPVTRGQMATFLARALGLHWDD